MLRPTSLCLCSVLGAALVLASCNSTPEPAAPAALPEAGPLGATSHGASLGIYRLSGDIASRTFSFERVDRPVQALGDSFAVDITLLSTTTLRFTGVDLPDFETLRLEMSWEHPLPDTTNRRDLSVFDLRAHVLTSAADATSFSGSDGMSAPTGAAGASEPVVLADITVRNADGWSSWGDEVVEPAVGAMAPSLYPYVLLHQDDGRAPVNPTSPAGWNCVPHGPGVYDFHFDIAIETGGTLDFLVALDASYGASAMKSIANPGTGSRLNPRYLNPEFNVKEAWRASAALTPDNDIEGGNPADFITLDLTAYDHQGALPASGAFDPLTDPITSLRYASNLASAAVSIPGAIAAPLTLTGASFTGDGTPTTPFTASLSIFGDDITGAPGDYVGVVAFVDEMRASASATTPLPTKGFDRGSAIQNRHDFATYMPFTITVLPYTPVPGTWTQVHDLIVNGDLASGASACALCHEGGTGGLFMDSNSPATYANLVNVVSSCGGRDYVEPGNSAMSFLYEKIASSTPACGIRMPCNGPPYLSPAKIALVQSWIDDGAPFN